MIERRSHTPTLVTLFAGALFAAGARADDLESPMFSFNAFGTLGVVHSSERQADFTSNVFKPNGAGYGHAWSADVDSLIAGQVTADFAPKLTAVLQVISQQNYDNTYRPHVEWANIKYQVTPDLAVRAGRTLLPTFLFSDTRNVAYTYPWVRPPLGVYRQAPVTASDGVDASYGMHKSDFSNVLQAHFGKSENELPAGRGTIRGRQSWGLAYTSEYHAATLHIAYESTHITLDATRPIFDAFRQFGPAGIAIADNYAMDDARLTLITIGARFDPGRWFVIGEAAHSVSHSFFGETTGWYVSGGYRFGKITPYLTYGQAMADNLSDPGLNLSTLPPPLIGPAAGLNAALNSLLSAKPVQDTLSIGGRWDVMTDVAFKLQYDHSRIGTGSSGVLSNLQPGFQSGGTLNVFTATVNFVY